MTRNCTRCAVSLTAGENWQGSRVVKKDYICRDCHATQGNLIRMFVNGKYVPRTHPLHKAGHYKSFDDAAFSSLTNYTSTKSGHVYAMTNAAWPEWIKIGKAIDAEDRLSSYQTSSPMRDYKLVYLVHFEDRNVAERNAHTLAALKTAHPWNKQDNGEWFKLTEIEAIEILKETTDD